ncbi:hypothetical protein J2847_006012 [Azospirillum agricola]|uniref:hypothetical protein n=1 Tax=Azospirillum agricola TaxID=1720247 RepID=UPI001AE32AED|nr:hypothetical protein [Azospirillum agricola]MBP2232681.1 hypothetical protein [Azospirillum agricola]
MARFTTLLSVSLPLALLAGGALGQTVADYEAALAAAPVTDSTSAVSVAHCRTLTNYVFTNIPGGERSGLVLPLYTFSGSDAAGIADKRAACGEVRKQPLIAFDGGTGEQIVTPAEALASPTDRGPYYKEPSADTPVPHTGRATPRQPMPRTGTP